MNATETKTMYEQLGISEEVWAYGQKIEDDLRERFRGFDETAEYNQLKVIRAMQENRVSEACFNYVSGYGYNDMGRDTLEAVYASTFHTEAALVRPQITCGTHALALALSANLRPFTGGQTIRYAGGSDRHPAFQGIPCRIRDHLPSGGTSGGRIF